MSDTGCDYFETPKTDVSKIVYDIIQAKHRLRCSQIELGIQLVSVIGEVRKPIRRVRIYNFMNLKKDLYLTGSCIDEIFDNLQNSFDIKIGFFNRLFCRKKDVGDIISLVKEKIDV